MGSVSGNQIVFTIDSQNRVNIYVPPFRIELEDGTVSFASEAEFQALAADWPGSRLVAIWNAFHGNVPVKKFTNQAIAMRRLWKVLEDTGVFVAQREGKKPPYSTEEPPIVYSPNATKSEVLLALLRQPGGATLKALMAATSWQAHSVRGFISAQLTKKLRLKVKSFRREGERVYSVKS